MCGQMRETRFYDRKRSLSPLSTESADCCQMIRCSTLDITIKRFFVEEMPHHEANDQTTNIVCIGIHLNFLLLSVNLL